MLELDAITDLLYEPGLHMAGSNMSDEEAITYARSKLQHCDYCIVRKWIWIDLDVSDEQQTELAKTYRQPVILYAHNVIFDSRRRWDEGDFVRTSPLYAFTEDFHFRTLSTMYLLLGDGTRKRAALETMARIF